MRYLSRVALITAAIFLASCMRSSCPEGKVAYLSPPYPPQTDSMVAQPQLVDINGQEILVNRIISGAVCNDTWNDTVYLTCDIQIPAWDKDPFFFQDCDLEIAEDAVVYVEAHKNKAFTDGCSCHE